MKKIILFLVSILITSTVYAADSSLPNLTADTTPGADSLLYTVKDPLGTPLDRKTTLGQLFSLVSGGVTINTSGVATVVTNANLTGAITSVGNATSLSSFTSANLSGALTNETGTGLAVFATSPTLTTPLLGTPTSGVMTNVTGLPLSTGVTGTLSVANGGTGVTSSTGTTNVVLSNSPTLVSPLLGTPTSGVMTNVTGLPLTTGVTGVLPVANGGTNASSASITAFNNITGFTASGATGTTSTNLVFSTSPTLTTPILGTPTSVTLTNGTGLPISTGVSGLGTGVATFLATPSSTNLASALTDETGTGNAVFSASPTLTGTITASGLTLSGNFAMGTNTAANLLIADGTSFKSIAMSSDATITSAGVLTVASKLHTDTKCINIDPTNASTNWIMFRAPTGIALTMTAANCLVDTGTVVLTPQDCGVNGSSCANITSAITCATTNTNGSITTAAVAAGEYIRVTRGATTGSPLQATICLDFTK